MNIRPFEWRDFSLLRNYLNRGLFLDNTQVLTRGKSLVPMGAYLSFVGPSTRSYTYRTDDTDKSRAPLIGQLTYAQGSSNARLTFLAPEDSMEQAELSAVSDFMAAQMGNLGVFHILVEVDECSQVFELLHRAGFAIYARQRIWRLPDEPAGTGEPATWSSCRSKDLIGVRSLYCNVVPGLVQQIEPLPKKDLKGVVYYRDGEIHAYVELKYGRNGIWVQPFVHPDEQDFDRYLIHFLHTLPGRGKRSLYICIRSYQSWLESAIEAMGAQPFPGQAVMVRHLTVARQVEQAFSVPAINGKRIEPTAPIVRIEDAGYSEPSETERRTRANSIN